MDDFIVNYLLHFQISRHTTIPDVHESARDVLKAWFECKFVNRSILVDETGFVKGFEVQIFFSFLDFALVSNQSITGKTDLWERFESILISV